MNYLFDKKDVERFFESLGKKERNSDNKYSKFDKDQEIHFCEKQIFVKRLENKLLPSKFLKIYDVDNRLIKYIKVLRIIYGLNRYDDLKIFYLDYGDLSKGIQSKNLRKHDIKKLEGEISEKQEFYNLLDLFVINLPEKTFRFKAYDLKNYKVGKTKKDVEENIDIKALTMEEAIKKSKKLDTDLWIENKCEML